MKKILFVISFVVIGLYSCKKTNELSQSSKKYNSTKNLNKILSDPGDGEWDVLGSGYDVTGNYGNAESCRLEIVDVNRFEQDYPTYIKNSGAETGTHIFVAGSNVEDFSTKLTERYDITLGIPKLFGGTVSENFTGEDKWSSKYIYATYSSIAVKKTLYMIPDIELIKNYLYPQFLNDVQTRTPQQLVNLYGTHLLRHIKLGGKLELIYRAETHSYNRTEAAGSGSKASFKEIFNLNTEGSYSETEASSNFNETAFVRTVGGNSAAGIVNTITFNSEGDPSATYNTAAWASGVTDDNAELIDIVPGGLIPIYELISDPIKKAEVKAYIDQYITAKAVRMSQGYSTMDGMGDYAEAGGVAIGNINSNSIADAVFMVYDAPSGPNQFRYKIAFDMNYGIPTSVSNTKVVSGLGDHCEGASIAIADIDKNGQNDIILMANDAPAGPNYFKYKIGYNLNNNGDVAYWSNVKLVSGVGDSQLGAGLSFGDIDKNGTLDMVLMAYEPESSGSTQVRYKIGYNVNSNGDATSWSTVKYQYGLGAAIDGCAIALTDIDANGTLDLVMFVENNPSGMNEFRYKIGYNLNSSGVASFWGNTVVSSGVGHESDGGGMAFGDLDGNSLKDAIIMAIDAPSGPNQIRYKVGLDLNSAGKTFDWH